MRLRQRWWKIVDRNDQVVLPGDSNHVINVFEVVLVGGEGIVVEAGLLAIDVRLGPVADAQQHDLREGKSMAFGLLNDHPGFFQRVLAEKLPLRRAQPEDWVAVLVGEISSVLTHLEGINRLSSSRICCPGRYGQHRYGQQRGFQVVCRLHGERLRLIAGTCPATIRGAHASLRKWIATLWRTA